jgi:cytochrome c553
VTHRHHRLRYLVAAFVASVASAGSHAADGGAPAVTAAPAAPVPAWAYPVNPPLDNFDGKIKLRVAGSARTFTRAQIEDDFSPPDWHPEDHPALPEVVAHGRQPAVLACMKCHLSNGFGHPESSDLAGLPVSYIQQQVAEIANGNRKGARATSMIPISKAVTPEELLAAARYFSQLKPTTRGWRKVVETQTVPVTRLGTGGMRFAVDGGGTEPIGERIIELPQNPLLAERRDSRTGFMALVPVGSLEKGKALVSTGGGKTVACATCHGPDLRGNADRPELKALGDVPNIVGRSPMYVFRQLNDIKLGTRGGPVTVLMQGVVAPLNPSDMVAIAAYLSTAAPGASTATAGASR